jgi:membrane associated rhomboid family serine protease
MLPIRDTNPTRTVPFVNFVLIGANVVVWLFELWLIGAGASWLIPGYGVVPSRISSDPGGEAFTVLTSMFMHGGWEHLGGNMLFLYIFGDNVEDALGHFRYILFYLACGVAAAVAQIAIDPGSPIPMVGASGAIAGVLGAYLVLYPQAPILVVNPIFPLWFVFGVFLEFPAWLVVGEWFVWNLIRGVSVLGVETVGGVAFFAHLGGFVLGLLAIRPAMIGRLRRESERWHGWRPPQRPARGAQGPHRDPWNPPDRRR